MVNEERFLWVFCYRVHGKKRGWWSYFKDQQEAEEWKERIMQALPCVQIEELKPYPQGLQVDYAYYYSRCSNQAAAEMLRGGTRYDRPRWWFPLAPFATDYQASFVATMGKVGLCEYCAALLPTHKKVLQE
jgi:hypothetical protein